MVSPFPQGIYLFTITSLIVFRKVPALRPLLATPRDNHLSTLSMVRGVKKEHLPEKVCVVCHRPFTWRKKWESCWDDVTTCSKSCNRKRRASQQAANRAARVDDNGGLGRENALEITREATLFQQSSIVETDFEEDEEADIILCNPQTSEHFNTDRDAARLLLEGSPTDRMLSDTVAASDEDDPKMARKLAKKQMKELQRLKRQGLAPDHGRKTCDVCSKSSDLLIRCTIDATEQWKMVCGSCWNTVSGGVVDGDANHPHYRYGGLWKNRARRL